MRALNNPTIRALLDDLIDERPGLFTWTIVLTEILGIAGLLVWAFEIDLPIA